MTAARTKAAATNYYFDASSTSGLTAGGTAANPITWDNSNTTAWQTTSSPGNTAPVVWLNGSIANFQTGGSNTLSVSGTVIAEGLTQTVANTATTINNGTIQLGATGISNTGGNQFTIASAVTLTANTSISNDSSTRTINLNGSIGDGNNGFGLTKTGANGNGTAALNAVNTYTGVTTLNAGTLQIGVNDAINKASSVNFTANSKLDLNGKTLTIAGLANSGGTSDVVDNVIGTAATLTIDTSTSFSYSQQINGTGLALVKNGVGTQTLARVTGNNGYTGGTTINAGVLAITGGNNIGGTGANVVINVGGTLAFNNTTNLQTAYLDRIDASSTGTFALGLATSTALNFTGKSGLYLGATGNYSYTASAGGLTPGSNGYLLGGGGGTLTIGTTNLLTSTNALTIRGNVTLSNAQNFSGNTTIKSGTLALGSAGTLGTSAVITVGDTGSSGAVLDLASKSSYSFTSTTTLRGIGSVNLGSGKTLTVAGHLAPGDLVGTLNITGDLALTGTMDAEVNGTEYDKVSVTGGVTLTGSTLNIILGYAPTSGDSYTLINNDAADTVSGTFNGLAPGAIFDETYLGTTYHFQISYAAGTDSNDVVVTAVPEPCTLSLLGVMGLLAGRRRRRA